MPNLEDVNILLLGVGEWNQYRHKQPYLKPNLRGVSLFETQLRGVDLSDTDLRDADLDGSTMSGAILRQARLNGSTLHGTFLDHADLTGAELLGAVMQEVKLDDAILVGAVLDRSRMKYASLRSANLRGASLRNTSLESAQLSYANLRGANLTDTDFHGADLRAANVESVWVTIDRHGESFWMYTDLSAVRNLTQEQLETMKGDSLTILPGELTRPYHWKILDPDEYDNAPFVFLSYSHEDRITATKFAEYIKGHGLDVWWDDDIKPGEDWRQAIDRMLSSSATTLTLWTENSVASKPVMEEAAMAQTSGKLVHARLDDAALPYGFGETQYASLQGWDVVTDTPQSMQLVDALKRKVFPDKYDHKSHLERSSVVAFGVKNGRIYSGDKPLDARPSQDDPDTLEQRVSAQVKLVRVIDGELDHVPQNFDIPQLKRRLGHYCDTLDVGLKNWFEPDDCVQRIVGMMTRENASDEWNKGIVDDLLQMVKRHQEMEPLLRPQQAPEGSSEAIVEPPLSSGPHDFSDGAAIADALDEAVQSAEMAVIAEPEVAAEFMVEVEDIREALATEEFLPEQKDKKHRWLARALAKAGGRVAAFAAAVSSAVVGTALISNEAAAILLTRYEAILAMLSKIF